ncbi:hypothetical protein Pta02_50260 [Planobispora takensis]|uniref:Uncharacterized protein n=1 Tax=Planobispora takensis TaxID=1367882 RepID=A0A8J3T2D5_9ACTN|nr:hypothetical protein Pta02_50260 [Planobispora takensis]
MAVGVEEERMADRSAYDAFVAAHWQRLLRTAYLLTRDRG